MSSPTKHIHLPYTIYSLCKKDGGISSNKTHSNCKTCLKLYKRYKEMVRELEQNGSKSFDEPTKILKKHGFI